jgi:phage terminase large subunit
MTKNEILVDIDKGVFNNVYIPHLDNMARTQIYFGGSSSGKSVFVAQRVVLDLLGNERNYLIARKVARTLRRSVFTEVSSVIREWGLSSLFDENLSTLAITCANGRQAVFVGLDDTEKVKSIRPDIGAFTDIWIEEATEVTLKDIGQLRKRQRGGKESTPKRLTMTFNPIYKSHPIYKEYFEPVNWVDAQEKYHGRDLSILRTWYIHNRFLTSGDIYDLEHEKDEYMKQVYTFGHWGVLGDVIFRNWRVEPCEDEAALLSAWHGLDFGYSKDPAALVSFAYDKRSKTIYIYDELYQRGLTNDMLAKSMTPKVGYRHVIADSAEPKSIDELRKLGLNVVGAAKGKDSVWFGIQWLKQHEIIVDPSCVNMQNELSVYQWKKDRHGESTNKPVDAMNHLIDALRYGAEPLMSYQPAIW